MLDQVRAGVSLCKALFLLCSARTEEAKSDNSSSEADAEVAAAWEVVAVTVGEAVAVA